MGSTAGAAVRALTFEAICGFSFLVLYSRVFLRVLRFSPPLKNQHLILIDLICSAMLNFRVDRRITFIEHETCTKYCANCCIITEWVEQIKENLLNGKCTFDVLEKSFYKTNFIEILTGMTVKSRQP